MAPVRSYRIPMIKVPVVRGERSSVLKSYLPYFNTLDSDQFSIRGTEAGVLAIAGEQEFVTRSDFNLPALVDGEKTSLL